jgi:hypothetical protein
MCCTSDVCGVVQARSELLTGLSAAYTAQAPEGGCDEVFFFVRDEV